LDARSFEDALAIAQAKADQAQDAYRRMEPMHRNKTIPEIKWVDVESGLRQAQHALSLSKKNLDDTVLHSPEAGSIAKRNAEVGVNIVPGIPAFVLIQKHVVLATAAMPEREIGCVRPGQTARVVVGALKRSFTGTIREVGVAADPLTRTYPVKVAVDNADGAMSVGMVADVYLCQESDRALVVVPPEAVRLDESGKTCVYVLTKEIVKRRSVDVVGYSGEQLAIASGLAEGEQVVISGTPMLSDGIPVRVQQQKGGE
jgi:RND family efflux transporter MFP subunit